MKAIRLLTAIALILISIHCHGKSKIVFEYTEYNFGNVKKNSAVTHIFKFYNKGNSTLTIDRVKAG